MRMLCFLWVPLFCGSHCRGTRHVTVDASYFGYLYLTYVLLSFRASICTVHLQIIIITSTKFSPQHTLACLRVYVPSTHWRRSRWACLHVSTRWKINSYTSPRCCLNIFHTSLCPYSRQWITGLLKVYNACASPWNTIILSLKNYCYYFDKVFTLMLQKTRAQIHSIFTVLHCYIIILHR